jgi:hypothetical protein
LEIKFKRDLFVAKRLANKLISEEQLNYEQFARVSRLILQTIPEVKTNISEIYTKIKSNLGIDYNKLPKLLDSGNEVNMVAYEAFSSRGIKITKKNMFLKKPSAEILAKLLKNMVSKYNLDEVYKSDFALYCNLNNYDYTGIVDEYKKVVEKSGFIVSMHRIEVVPSFKREAV